MSLFWAYVRAMLRPRVVSGGQAAKALDIMINARQVFAHLHTYRNSPSGARLDDVRRTLEVS